MASVIRLVTVTVVSSLAAVLVGTALAAPTATQACDTARAKEAQRFSACEQKARGKIVAPSDVLKYHTALSKCRMKYIARWPKLQAKHPTGVPCNSSRFVDNGDGTVTDNLTGIQWEKKTDDSSVHDKDNLYSWSSAFPSIAADGTVFTGFLSTLNAACFAGHCDWRLPTYVELVTLVSEPYPCVTSPCLDQGFFGPTENGNYLTSNYRDIFGDTSGTAPIEFQTGTISNNGKPGSGFARAARSLL